MHSSVRRAANGISSAKRAWEDPNRSFTSEARNEPRASAASAGNVIMPRGLNCWFLHNNRESTVVGQRGRQGVVGERSAWGVGMGRSKRRAQKRKEPQPQAAEALLVRRNRPCD